MALDFGEFSLSQKNNLTTKVLAIDKKKQIRRRPYFVRR